MRTIWMTVLLAAMALTLQGSSLGQIDMRTLQVALHGEHLVLRSYSADPVTQYKWVNGELLTGEIKLHGRLCTSSATAA